MSLSLTLNTALTSLQTQQAGLQIVSNNVSNATTEGYTRKTAEQAAITLNGIGSGVELGAIRRNVDQALLREIRDTLSSLGTERISEPYFKRMQDLFGAPGSDSSISATITDLSSALGALAATPEGTTERSKVIDAAVDLVRQLDSMSNEIQTMRGDVERQISGTIDQINAELQNIADLNDEIRGRIATKDSVAALEDKRDQALHKLAGFIDIQTFTRSSGEVVIFTQEGTLLDSFPNFLSHGQAGTLAANVTYPTGIDGISLNNRDITTTLTDGALKGLIGLRDNTLAGLQSEIDQLALAVRDEINALHNKGTSYPPQSSFSGTRLFDSTSDQVAVSGTLRFAIVDRSGNVPDNLATATPFSVDLGALAAPVTIQDVVNAINTQATASPPQVARAQLVPVGTQFQLRISTLSTGQKLIIDENNSRVTGFTPNGGSAQTTTLHKGTNPGFSHFFGLNDFFVSPDFNAGDGNSTGLTRAIDVRQDLKNDPSKLARGTAAFTLPLTGGQNLVGSGSNGTLQALAAKFDEPLAFAASGNLAATRTTLAGYGAEIVFDNSTAAVRSENKIATQKALKSELQFRSDSLSGVNIDQELTNMIVIQQAYSASARLVSTVQELFSVLQKMIR